MYSSTGNTGTVTKQRLQVHFIYRYMSYFHVIPRFHFYTISHKLHTDQHALLLYWYNYQALTTYKVYNVPLKWNTVRHDKLYCITRIVLHHYSAAVQGPMHGAGTCRWQIMHSGRNVHCNLKPTALILAGLPNLDEGQKRYHLSSSHRSKRGWSTNSLRKKKKKTQQSDISACSPETRSASKIN